MKLKGPYIELANQTVDPSSPPNGAIWVRNDVFRKKQSGVITDLDTGGGGGGISRSVNNISGNTTAGATALTDYVYFCTATLTLTMPTAVGNTNKYTVKCIAGTLTIDGAGAETIEGTATIQVAVEDSVDLISNNTEWKIV